MSDNVSITAGSGTVIATDDVGGGVQVQRVKTAWGPDGTANDVDSASGKPLPVQLRGSDGTDYSAALPAKDSGPAQTISFGIAGARFQSNDQSASPAVVTSVPTSGQKLVITDLVVSVDTSCAVTFTEETSGTALLTLYMAANSGGQVTPRGKLKLATSNKRLMVQTSVAAKIAVTAFYYSEA